jgi:hypothetical protein
MVVGIAIGVFLVFICGWYAFSHRETEVEPVKAKPSPQ